MRITSLLVFAATTAIMISLAACGGGTRRLQNISVSPATATGSTQFTATGMFSEPPSPMMLTTGEVAWCVGSASGACAEAINVPATVDDTGKAQCLPGQTGRITVIASDPNMKPPQPLMPAKVFGTATITCP